MTPLIVCRALGKTYLSDQAVETVALRGATFSIDRGEFVALMGPSGSGKSTLMHLLGLLDRPTAGSYFLGGEDTNAFSSDRLAEIRNKNLGFVFQSFNLLPRTSVFENVELPLLYDMYESKRRESRGVAEESGWHSFLSSLGIFRNALGGSRARDRVMRALVAVGMEHRASYFTNQLSGGEMQRVAIARALVNNPDIIFADEPTGNLDSKSGLAVMAILQKLNDEGKTVILVTHESTTARHGKRMLSLMDGAIVGDAPIENRVFAREEQELTK
ncbi:MAG: ABC transporter ATP-binding protein [Candidatus Moraniibacteriota bacterium]|nr:MAG: ABC transporter ATP-binding protein [Candidatus Moranbacteria bacterium]